MISQIRVDRGVPDRLGPPIPSCILADAVFRLARAICSMRPDQSAGTSSGSGQASLLMPIFSPTLRNMVPMSCRIT